MRVWETTLQKEWTLRYCQELVAELGLYEADFLLKTKDKTINMKSLLGLCSLLLQEGESVTICVFGDDEEEALHAVKQLFHTNQPS
ncbi:HPr family phosphocarrier protein [Ectobacillus sp. JY-23]|uniref:HPr family phosphocarrier protein n=1 Tax=Ectobacillus sp. JY-23 TaxID=2933872 RepID=UPI001FF49610|nr:HPr family phosphocarrier protein [Ectobacillus sp. JY-23]UOY92776.1 HPr family phosphocarrier protein [Ectobacillus sp. JY-23]